MQKGMTNADSIRFTLDNSTNVIVKQVTDNTYDFELIFSNGSRRTFIWIYGTTVEFKNRKGNRDLLMIEAVDKFYCTIQK